MKKVIPALLLISLFAPYIVFAEDLESTNYKIQNATLNSGGSATTSNTGDFKLINTIGDFSGDPRVYSTLYKASIGEVELFTASIPTITCFETVTDGSSSCTSGPAYITSGGMARVCGPGGCYDRARVEIDAQGNPADTLYSLQISTDNFVSDIKYIDGITKKPKVSERTIDDYLSKSSWETDSANILGLSPNTTYKIRATALHGDFSETSPGPSVSATTGQPTMSFDIDIAPMGGIGTETSDPYDVAFNNNSKLIPTGPTKTSADLIWLDMSTNGKSGIAIAIKGENGGLESTTESYTIDSVSNDLDAITEGYGLQNYYFAYLYNTSSGNGELAEVMTETQYLGSGNNVGEVGQTFGLIYNSAGPVYSGRTGTYLKARASSSTPPATDYTEILTIVAIPRY